jgi:predicted nuclease with TOPRIM domain
MANIKPLLPEENITIKFETTPSLYANSKGFNISNIKTSVSNNANEFYSPIDKVNNDMNGLWKTSVNSAKPYAAQTRDLSTFFPKETVKYHIYPVEDHRHFETDHVKSAKKLFGYGDNVDIGEVDNFLIDLEKTKLELDEKNKKDVETMEAEVVASKGANNTIIKQETERLNKLNEETDKIADAVRLLRYNISKENIYILLLSGKITKSLADIMLKKLGEGPKIFGYSLVTKFERFDTSIANTNIDINAEKIKAHMETKKAAKEELNKTKKELNKKLTEIGNVEYKIRELKKDNERLDKELNDLKDVFVKITTYRDVLIEYYNSKKNASISSVPEKKLGGYQVKSKKYSIKRGGYKVKSKKYSIKRGGKKHSKKK